MSEGKYISILDDDDMFINTRKLAEQYSFLEVYPEYKVVGTNIAVMDAGGKRLGQKRYPLTDKEIRDTLLIQNQFCHSSTMFRRDTALDVGGYQQVEGLWNINEYLLWLQLGVKGKMANLPMQSVAYTVWPRRASWMHQFKLYLKDYKMSYEFRDEYPHFFRACWRYLISYPISYLLGKRWWQKDQK